MTSRIPPRTDRRTPTPAPVHVGVHMPLESSAAGPGRRPDRDDRRRSAPPAPTGRRRPATVREPDGRCRRFGTDPDTPDRGDTHSICVIALRNRVRIDCAADDRAPRATIDDFLRTAIFRGCGMVETSKRVCVRRDRGRPRSRFGERNDRRHAGPAEPAALATPSGTLGRGDRLRRAPRFRRTRRRRRAGGPGTAGRGVARRHGPRPGATPGRLGTGVARTIRDPRSDTSSQRTGRVPGRGRCRRPR